jgi:ATP-binding cassette subfamily F protein uup
MLDRVSTMLVALDGQGGVGKFADVAQWEAAQVARPTTSGDTEAPAPRERVRARPRLGYHEQREWDAMEQAILDAEARAERSERAVQDPAVASDATALQQRYAELESARAEVDRLYARWAELEAKLRG